MIDCGAHGQNSHAGSNASIHSRIRVFHNQTRSREDPKALSRQDEHFRIRLGPGDVRSVHHGIKGLSKPMA